MKRYKVGVIGLGQRGIGWARDSLPELGFIDVVALSDIYPDRLNDAYEQVKAKTGNGDILLTQDYRELIDSDRVEVVVICSGWANHFEASIRAMKAGKPVACEVGGAYSIDQCRELVRVYEETKTPYMMLENCCYGERELTVMKLAREGVLGRIVACDGGYHHEMRAVLAGIGRDRHYRGREYMLRNGENYPTHELGPIGKILNINSGNRYEALLSVSSGAFGMKDFLADKGDEYKDLEYKQGDIFTTFIKCAGGETVTIRLDTTLPRYYTRNFTVRGTRGMYDERNDSLFLSGIHEEKHNKWRSEWGNMEKFMSIYRHPLWQWYRKSGVVGTHGGMDRLVISAFFDALDNGYPMPVDVYDAVSMMVVTVLSEMSVSQGNTWVAFPDFTDGRWMNEKERTGGKYEL